MNCCNEFSRSTMLRRAVAEAGNGLPAIEPGMPAPAGTGLDRRRFLSRTVGAALTVYGASALGPRMFDEGIARAAATAGAGRRVLVSIFAPGGWDALSLLYPTGDPRYRKLRNSLAMKPGDGPVFRSDQRLHWHPSLAPLARLHARGRLTVFPAIGYSHPDQSHFTSRHFWEVGALDPQAGTGWLGRLLDVIGDDENAMQGLSLDGALLPSLATARVPVATLASPADYGFGSHNVWDVPGELLQDAIGSLGAAAADPDPVLALAGKTIKQSNDLHRQLGRFIGKDGQVHINPKAKYPDSDFGRRLSGPGGAARRELPDPNRSADRPRVVRHARRPAGPAAGRGRRRSRKVSPRSSPTSSGAGSRAACSRSSGASSAAAPSRTTRTAPTTAPPASPS